MNTIKELQSPGDKLDGSLRIVKVEGRGILNDFIRLPWSIYRDDPVWVPPLLFERRQHLSAGNPYFEHSRYCFWIVYRGTKPVGRISAQVDQLHLDRYQDATGFFGMIEAENNPEIFQSLFDTAETWLRKQGMVRVLGPFNLSINQECGLLIDGFETPPSVMMGHARPYYGDRIEELGLRKEKDLLAYTINAKFEQPKAMKKIAAMVTSRVRIRYLRESNFKEDLEIIQDIYNNAWSQNWGFIPFTKAEFDQLKKDLKLLTNEELVIIAEVDRAPAAFIVMLPNLNEVIQDLNGRLLPFGWLKMLWRLKVKYPLTSRIPLMGVCRQYHNSLLGSALAYMLIVEIQRSALKHGFKVIELSWILEDNMGMRNIIDKIGATVYKTYRIYSKALY